jgi:DNA-binding NtrC family response regulator
MSLTGRILLVEDSEPERKALAAILKNEGHTVFSADSADKALSYLDENIDVVLSDLEMGDVSGMDLLTLWKKRKLETHFVLITGHGSVPSAVQAIKNGAYDYVTKPVNADEVLLIIGRALQETQKDREIDNLRRRLDQKFGLDNIVGQSKAIRDVFSKIQRAAAVDSTVLILGESGTGKELVAQALHHNSPRKKGPFVAVNCAAVPATLVESELFGHVRGAFTGATDRRMGRFEQADGGTLFIDEIGDFELGLQAKLLRVLETPTVTPVGGHEERKVNVRVLAATSRDIMHMVENGTFREDLFYRLNVVQINLPPLRDRLDDLPILVDHFLADIATVKRTAPKRVTPEVLKAFQSYRWPGNIRELRNTLESMMVLSESDILTERDLPDRLTASYEGMTSSQNGRDVPSGVTIEELEKLAIIKVLNQCNGNRTHAANRLGISVRTLQRKLRQYELERPTPAAPPATFSDPPSVPL